MTKEELWCVKDGLSRQKLYKALESIEFLEKENEQLKQQLENEKQLNAEIKKRLVEVEYDCEEFNHEYCDINCKGKRKELVDLYQLISDGLNETLLKQKEEENKQLAKRICELQSDLSKAKTMIEKMKNCCNCKYFVDSDNVCNQGLYLANRDFTECYEWELAE